MISFLLESEDKLKYKCALLVDFCKEEDYNGIGNT
jgi:hypothetical protein